ncbi:GGDEF domain-containing protein [Actinoplanes sp. NPDC049118]|uniref:GGDEF domain-containing protein n=1 Tax=Actinoplanes sp. NPDC049118 TaxID=3155769 RepID=UPI0033ED20E4
MAREESHPARSAAIHRDPVVAAFAALSAVAIVGFGLTTAGGPVRLVAFWLLMAIAHAAFAAVAWQLAAPNRQGGGPRRLFICITAAGAVLAAGDLVRVAGVMQHEGPGFAVAAIEVQQATVGISILLLVVGLLRSPLKITSGARARLRLDVATVMAGATTVGVWVFEVPPGEPSLHWARHLAIAMLLQPGLFLLVVFAFVRLVVSGHSPFTRTAAGILSAAAVLQAVLRAVPDSVYQSPRFSGWLLAGSLTGSALLAIGLRTQVCQPHSPSRVDRGSRRPYSALPYAAMAITWALTTALLMTQGPTWRTWLICAGCGVTTTLVIFRQLAAFQHIAELLREREQLTAQLTEQAFRDDLTGLPNRARLMQRLTALLTDGPVTVFLIDLNDFKPVNDTYGHAAGDRLLIEVGARLRSSMRTGDTAARLGGDEFAVLMPGYAGHRLPDLTAALNGTVQIDGNDVPLSASIGCAEGTGHAEELLHRADLAMYGNKRSRCGSVQRGTAAAGLG